MKMIEFLHPQFNATAPNVTVRKGIKWGNAVAPGDLILVGATSLAIAIPAFVTRVVVVPSIGEIEPDMLALEHDASCRTPEGLDNELARIYGDDYADEGLSVVQFELAEGGPMPVIIDDRHIVADTKRYLHARAEHVLQKARAMALAASRTSDPQDVHRYKTQGDAYRNEAGNLKVLASIMTSRQVALSLLVAYGGPGPNWMIDPSSLEAVEKFYGKEEVEAPKQQLGGEASKKALVDCVVTVEHGDAPQKELGITDEPIEMPVPAHEGDGPPAGRPDPTLILEEVLRQPEGLRKFEDVPHPGLEKFDSEDDHPAGTVWHAPDPTPEEEAAYLEPDDGEEDGGVSTRRDSAQDAADLALDEAVADAWDRLDAAVKKPDEYGDTDSETLCYRCKEPVSDPGTACVDCQDEIDADPDMQL